MGTRVAKVDILKFVPSGVFFNLALVLSDCVYNIHTCTYVITINKIIIKLVVDFSVLRCELSSAYFVLY